MGGDNRNRDYTATVNEYEEPMGFNLPFPTRLVVTPEEMLPGDWIAFRNTPWLQTIITEDMGMPALPMLGPVYLPRQTCHSVPLVNPRLQATTGRWRKWRAGRLWASLRSAAKRA